MTYLPYTGIGSRKTPIDVLAFMAHVGCMLARAGWTLRSGGADGADRHFELGALLGPGPTEIYWPWNNFVKEAKRAPGIVLDNMDARSIAAKIHPKFQFLKHGAKKLHQRNVHQVLGQTLDKPSRFVICWTEGGEEIGGTRTAIVLAKQHNIPVYNLGEAKYKTLPKMDEFLKEICNGQT